jgi:hypothetical protein
MAFLDVATRHTPARIRAATLAALLALLPLTRLSSQVAHPTANQVKAIFLFNFAQFVEWPDTAFAAPGSPLVIEIFGEDPFGAYLDETVSGETVRGRSLVVRRTQRIEDIRTCHILFLSPSEESRFDAILAALKDRPVLTVSDAPGFARRGGMVAFAFEQNRVRVKINPAAARTAGLTISSKLLHAADIVTPGP